MPVSLGTKTSTIATTRHITSIGIALPRNGAPRLEVHTEIVESDETGADVSVRSGPVESLNADDLSRILPAGDLPSFGQVYASLRDALHTEIDRRMAERAAALAGQ